MQWRDDINGGRSSIIDPDAGKGELSEVEWSKTDLTGPNE